MPRDTVSKITLLLLVFFISALFWTMVRPFGMAVFLAGIAAGITYPFFRRLTKLFGGRAALASLTTVVMMVVVIILPLGILFGIITAQAIKVGQSATPWVQQQINEPAAFAEVLRSIPYFEELETYREPILRKAGEMVGSISRFLINNLSAAALGTVNFIFMVFIMLYAMFFFLLDGDRLLTRILYYLPLKDPDEHRMLARFTSVTRATLKGTLIIGVLQGALAGLAFVAVGIDGAVFWGTIMTALSIIPAIGSGLIWFPAAVVLLIGGHYIKGIGLILFCGLVVGSLDNILRPRLVGRDVEMHDLMILFATLGGLALFGILGFIIGPIIAALFVTVWEIYGEVFRDVLPQGAPAALNRPKAAADPRKTSDRPDGG